MNIEIVRWSMFDEGNMLELHFRSPGLKAPACSSCFIENGDIEIAAATCRAKAKEWAELKELA